MTDSGCAAEIHSVAKLASIGADVLTQAIAMTPSAHAECSERLRGLVREVVSTLAFAGSCQGQFVLATSTDVAKHMCATMLMLGEDEMSNDEIADGFGEILNMMGGNYKNDWIATDGRRMDLTVPSTVFGHVALTSMRNATELRAVEFELDVGKMMFGIVTYG
ncbi:MAG: chemotaxis protein CheX [Planctomycetota bacterium]